MAATAALAASLAAWLVCSRIQAFQNSDAILQALISLQHWTPFYWGSDRFGMLVPLLAVPIRSPLANLLFQNWCNATAGLLAPFLLARYLAPRSNWFEAGAIANLFVIGAVLPAIQYDWLVNEPFGLSLALGLGGLIVLDAPGIYAIAAGAALLLAAHWVNVTIAALLAPLIVLRRRMVVRQLLPTAAAAVVVRELAQMLPVPHTPTTLDPVAQWPIGWAALLRTSIGALAPFGSVAAVIAVAIAALVVIVRVWKRHVVPEHVVASAIALAAAAAYWLVVGTSGWVRANQYFVRYMYPALAFASAAGALLVAGLWKPGGRAGLALAPLLFVVAGTVDGVPSLRHVRQARDPRFAVAARDVVDSGARVVAGNYWTAWPLVFDANAELYRRGSRRQVYGLTYRSTPTDDRWRPGTPLLIAAPIGDDEVVDDARALGLELKLAERRSLIEVFAARDAGGR